MILHSADYPDGHFLGWTPGQATPLASNDLAWRLARRQRSRRAAAPAADRQARDPSRPSIGLYFTERAAGAHAGDPAAGAAGHRHSRRCAPPTASSDAYVLPVDAELRAIQPHAHYRARSVSAWATLPGGARRPLILHQQLGFQLAGSATGTRRRSGCRRARSSRWNTCSTTRRRIRATRRTRRPRRLGLAIVGRDGRRLDSGDDARATPSARGWPDVRRKMAAEDAVGCEMLLAREPDHMPICGTTAAVYMELDRPAEALSQFAAVPRPAAGNPRSRGTTWRWRSRRSAARRTRRAVRRGAQAATRLLGRAQQPGRPVDATGPHGGRT